MISLFSLCFCTNTLLYPTCFAFLGIWDTGLKTSNFVNEFNFTFIVSFYFDQLFMCHNSSIFCGSKSSLFLWCQRPFWKNNIVNNNNFFISFFFRVYITFWNLKNFKYLCLFKSYLFNSYLSKGFLFNICLFKGYMLYLWLFKGYWFINFRLNSHFYGIF